MFKHNAPKGLPESIAHYGLEHGEGWNKIVLPVLAYCEKHNIEVHQVKEKFGGLRIYTAGSQDAAIDQELDAIIEAAEDVASVTCENCGASTDAGARSRPNGYWIRTLCDPCYKEWGDVV